ncbi:MFS transporter [Arthrobacter castelli]|uniref:MFS transporter n=1 Tax=Arthrobacter castelli TaxID=271431 RepID=UPI00041612B3|nr:MFS transporter [Arthrobacter castelli]
MSPGSARSLNAATVATFLVFGLNGFVFATWVARIPSVAQILQLNNSQTGALLLLLAVGSMLSLPLAGVVTAKVGNGNAVRVGGVTCAAGAVLISTALLAASVPLTGVGLFLFGTGVALWDVAMNIEGAEVERRRRRTIMPQFHAAFSGGAFVGALVGAGLAVAGVALPAHLFTVALCAAVIALLLPRLFLPITTPAQQQEPEGPDAPKRGSAWKEPRTVMLGLVVLGAALTEGAANDWIAKATVDGLGTDAAAGSVMFAVFVGAMTTFRFFGGRFVDRYGRVPVLRISLASALAGLLIFVFGPNVWISGFGAILWGAGAALGFPMGMSAAADEPERAAARVAVVSTVGYTAFLAGPPLLGFLGDQVGIRTALLAVGVVVIASLMTVGSAAERQHSHRSTGVETGKA